MPVDLFVPWPDPRRPDAEPKSHLQWAEHIARLIARAYGKWSPRSTQADELVAAAHAVLAALANRFDAGKVPAGGDPDGQFRGWAHVHVRGACMREAQKLRNGGTCKSTNDAAAKAITVGGIPERCPSCAVVRGWGTGGQPVRDDEDEDEGGGAEPISTKYEPTLVILWDGEPRAG